MRGGLAREVLDLRSLTESLVAAPAGERSERLQELEHAAHRLRGRAATLRLSALCTAAAALERLATTSAPAESLRLALAHCERALAQLSPS